MHKRKATLDASELEESRKKQRLPKESETTGAHGEEIKSGEDLLDLLHLQPGQLGSVLINLEKFQQFLISTQSCSDSKLASSKRTILLEYLQSDDKDDGTPGQDLKLVQLWTHAVAADHRALRTLVPSTLATLLTTIGRDLEFESLGLRLCRRVLTQSGASLLNKCFSTRSNIKGQTTAVLGLLIELISFGGGVNARNVYHRIPSVFESLESLVSESTKHVSRGNSTDITSTENLPVQFVLVNIQYQDTSIKSEILSKRHLIRALLADLKNFAVSLIVNILDVLWRFYIKDKSVRRRDKHRVFTEDTLVGLAELYRLPPTITESDLSSAVEAAHEILLTVCTTEEAGLLVKQYAWYPVSADKNAYLMSQPTNAELSHSIVPRTSYSGRVPVRNTILASFLQTLRPHTNRKECELTIRIFQAAPELVADYFLRRKALPLDPKQITAWIGQVSFIHATIDLEIPEMPDTSTSIDPPHESIVLESILPHPVERRAITKYLNHADRLIRLVALSLVKASLSKLERVLHYMQSRGPRWRVMGKRLVVKYSQRVPDVKHLIMLYQTSKNDRMIKSVVVSALRTFLTCMPELASKEKFDTSLGLLEYLTDNGVHTQTRHKCSLAFSDADLVSLLAVASFSRNIRWWYRPEGMALSAFTAVLRFYSESLEAKVDYVHTLLETTLQETSILQSSTDNSPLTALLVAFSPDPSWKTSKHTWQTFDDCVLRLVRRPVKYIGDHASLSASTYGDPVQDQPLNLMTMVLIEQWPFIVQGCDSDADLQNIAGWFKRYLMVSVQLGENKKIIEEAERLISESCSHLNLGSGYVDLKVVTRHSSEAIASSQVSGKSQHENSVSRQDVDTLQQQFEPPMENDSHKGLHRWASTAVDDAIEDGIFGELVMCLCSGLEYVRLQALTNLGLFCSRLEVSEYTEWRQIFLLSGELMETAQGIIATDPLPSFIASLAARASLVLHDPLHPIYAKLNKWLQRSPSWDLKKAPSQWIDMVLLQPPTLDGNHSAEALWVLDCLFEGLRSRTDLDLYIRCRVFERLFSVSSSSGSSSDHITKTTAIVYRASFLAGSTTLICRCGVLGWIQATLVYGKGDKALLHGLRTRLVQHCDAFAKQAWAGDLEILQR